MDRRFDPRSIVTPYAFAVHPDLLGRPLATPWQRLWAILLDLVVIFFISRVGAAPLAIASAALLFWLAFRKPGRDVFGKLFRVAVGCLGMVVLSATVLVIAWLQWGDEFERWLEGTGSGIQIETTGVLAGEGAEEGGGEGGIGFGDVARGFRGAVALQSAETMEEAQAVLNDLAVSAYDGGLPRSQIREILVGIIPDDSAWEPDAEDMVDEAITALSPEEEEAAQGQEAPGDPEGLPSSLSSLAQDSIEGLNQALQRAEDDREDLERNLAQARGELEAERDQGPLAWLWNLVDDLGIGFGWAALYLTIVHTWWKGTSVGKKVFRIRVVMIDKRPLNWWLSFERAGGYAAGFATGMLGFAQIFWDPNRQAIHDKVSETIVIQDGKDPVPGPWIEEGKAQWRRDQQGDQHPPDL